MISTCSSSRALRPLTQWWGQSCHGSCSSTRVEPFCDCRCAVDAVQHAAPHVRVIIYARQGVTAEQLVLDASSRFNVRLRNPIEVGAVELQLAEDIPHGRMHHQQQTRCICCTATVPACAYHMTHCHKKKGTRRASARGGVVTEHHIASAYFKSL
eukprot:GHUV01027925.1.p1 GENE.GHUV01027925.1~~GHUV01027925.1.p1  ORF type:complete len:155 (+),score=30.19 GHUV01027925.1:505-969(+)